MNNCSICEKHKKETFIFKGEHSIVSPASFNEGVFGYFYIEPIRHVEHWDELSEAEFTEITSLLWKLTAFLKKEVNADRVYTVTISEAVRHLHIHVIPREESSEVKGIQLIEQATQCLEYIGNKTLNNYSELLDKAKNYLQLK
jgi:diadenosine tetraphosphate (Ap4A) HIT family hydrolase